MCPRRSLWFLLARVSALASCSLLLGSGVAHCTETIAIYPSGDIADYCHSGPFLSERVALIVGFPSLSRSQRVVAASVRCLLTLWKVEQSEPGATAVSNGLLALLLVDPEATLTEMASAEGTVDSWLTDIETVSFSWSEAGPCLLDDYRRRLVGVLRHSKSSGLNEATRRKVVRRLDALHCHIID